MHKRILFYASVPDIKLFNTQYFYKIDIKILRDLGYTVSVTNKLIDFIYFWRYNLAFIYFYRFGLFAAIAAWIFNKKIYFTGGIDDLDKDFASNYNYFIQRIFFRLCYFFSTKCIIVSNGDYNNIKKAYHNKLKRKITLSFHAIDLDTYTKDIPRVKDNHFITIAWMGSKGNVIRKGVDRAIYLFNSIIKTYPKFEGSNLFIVGLEGEGSDYLKQEIEKLKICDRVVFTGVVDEKSKLQLLKQNKFYLQLSEYEGFGIAALEALATKCVVIHSGKGGLKDSISHYGILIDNELDITLQTNKIMVNIDNFDIDSFEKATSYISQYFSFEKRMKDFNNILT